MQIDTNGFEIEDTVRDRVTGFEGTITAISQFATGCARASIQPKISKKMQDEGKMPEAWSIDCLTLEMIKEGPRHKATPAATGAHLGGPPTRVR